jgi:hypothetical protein
VSASLAAVTAPAGIASCRGASAGFGRGGHRGRRRRGAGDAEPRGRGEPGRQLKFLVRQRALVACRDPRSMGHPARRLPRWTRSGCLAPRAVPLGLVHVLAVQGRYYQGLLAVEASPVEHLPGSNAYQRRDHDSVRPGAAARYRGCCQPCELGRCRSRRAVGRVPWSPGPSRGCRSRRVYCPPGSTREQRVQP